MMHDSPPPINRTAGFLPDLVPAGNRGARFLLKGVANHAKKDRISAESRGGFKIR